MIDMAYLGESGQIPFMAKAEITKRVEELLDECWDGECPINIEGICDYLGIVLLPVKDLAKDFQVEAFLAADFKTILVDEYGYRRESYRYRFSVAHELGHCVLHRDYYSSRVESYEEWLGLSQSANNGYAEFQANYFAGSLLVPEEELAGMLNMKFDGSMARHYWWVGREELERIMREVREFFKVSEQVVKRRMGEMVYGLEVSG